MKRSKRCKKEIERESNRCRAEKRRDKESEKSEKGEVLTEVKETEDVRAGLAAMCWKKKREQLIC